MGFRQRYIKWICGLAACAVLGLTACQSTAPEARPTVAAPPAGTAAPTQALAQIAVKTPLQTPTPAPTSTPAAPTATATPTPVFYEPAGCWQPPDDYSHVSVNNHTLSARTYAMLQHADALYDGEIDIDGIAVIQGSYQAEDFESPGIHMGGGAVDISVTIPKSSHVLYLEIEPVIRALRTAGLAAWLREADGLDGRPGLYVHAVAIGDGDLSPAAQEELTGYFSGSDGLPVVESQPATDRHGGPLLCRWMLAAGYADLRASTPEPTPGLPWQERLRLASLAYEAHYPEDAEVVADNLNFLDGKSEAAENICGPLSAAILRDAGLLPNQVGPVQELKSFWQSRPSTNGRPWILFSERDYEVFRFDTPLAEFDFQAWPLQPGDFLYTYAEAQGFEHMFVVTEVDAQGRAYTVTNQYQSWANEIWGAFLIERYMLYDPNEPGAGIIYNQWSDRKLGRTGHTGFEVMRKRGVQAGSMYAYSVRPGDTLPELEARFGASEESLAQANPGLDLANLQVGQPLTIPIPTYTPASTEPAQSTKP